MLQEVQEKREALQKLPEEVIQDIHTVFKVEDFSLHQNDESLLFELNLGKETVSFKACELIAFRKKIEDIDIVGLLSSSTPDVEILELPHCKRIFVLSIHNILKLKELLQGAFAMLELNSLIHRTLIRPTI